MKKSHTKPGKLDGTEREGLLIAYFGAHAEIEDEFGKIIYCHVRKNLENVITGDKILWQTEHDGSGVIVGCLPRKSLLAHPGKHGKSKPIAANIDTIIIVSAPATFSTHLLDRYLIAAENLKIPPLIVLNKTDTLTEKNKIEIETQLATYGKINYPIIQSSIFTKNGLIELEKFLENKTCALVGTSGVGKSSLISRFVPNQTIAVGETSIKGIGKHTTTATHLYHTAKGGKLIDSPGVREFGLWNATPQELFDGFVEFKPYVGSCKFRDCRHLKEPACALKQAAADNKISLQRLESYQKMILG